MASDLDLMIIGKVDLNLFSLTITSLKNELRRPINYVINSEEEWKE